MFSFNFLVNEITNNVLNACDIYIYIYIDRERERECDFIRMFMRLGFKFVYWLVLLFFNFIGANSFVLIETRVWLIYSFTPLCRAKL